MFIGQQQAIQGKVCELMRRRWKAIKQNLTIKNWVDNCTLYIFLTFTYSLLCKLYSVYKAAGGGEEMLCPPSPPIGLLITTATGQWAGIHY